MYGTEGKDFKGKKPKKKLLLKKKARDQSHYSSWSAGLSSAGKDVPGDVDKPHHHHHSHDKKKSNSGENKSKEKKSKKKLKGGQVHENKSDHAKEEEYHHVYTELSYGYERPTRTPPPPPPKRSSASGKYVYDTKNHYYRRVLPAERRSNYKVHPFYYASSSRSKSMYFDVGGRGGGGLVDADGYSYISETTGSTLTSSSSYSNEEYAAARAERNRQVDAFFKSWVLFKLSNCFVANKMGSH